MTHSQFLIRNSKFEIHNPLSNLEISYLLPRTSNLEPRTSNLEPLTLQSLARPRTSLPDTIASHALDSLSPRFRVEPPECEGSGPQRSDSRNRLQHSRLECSLIREARLLRERRASDRR